VIVNFTVEVKKDSEKLFNVKGSFLIGNEQTAPPTDLFCFVTPTQKVYC